MNSAVVAASLALLALLVTQGPSEAQPSDASVGAGQAYDAVAVFGAPPAMDSTGTLLRSEVLEAVTVRPHIDGGQIEDSVETLTSDYHDIMGTAFEPRQGIQTSVRRGWYEFGGGFGLTKTLGKHNVGLNANQGAIASAHWWQYDSGTTWRYEASATLYHCDWVCTPEETVDMRSIVDFRTLSDGYNFGVVTAYCLDIPNGWCPDWVNGAVW